MAYRQVDQNQQRPEARLPRPITFDHRYIMGPPQAQPRPPGMLAPPAVPAAPAVSGDAGAFLTMLDALDRRDTKLRGEEAEQQAIQAELQALRREARELRAANEELARKNAQLTQEVARAPAMVPPSAGLAFDAGAVGIRSGEALSFTLYSCSWGIADWNYPLRDYCTSQPLGRGAYGEVYRLANVSVKFDDRSSGDLVYKVVYEPDDEESAELAKVEVQSMLSTNTVPGVIGFFGCTFNRSRNITGFLLEEAKGGDLDNYIKKNPVIPLHLLVELMLDISVTIKSVHEKNIIHRDIKPANILLVEPITHTALGKTRVGDLGLARSEKVQARTRVAGTDSYMPPEAHAGKISLIGRPFDIYSLGVMFLQMMTKSVVHDEHCAAELSLEIYEEYTEEVRGLAKEAITRKQEELNQRWKDHFEAHCNKPRHKRLLDEYKTENADVVGKLKELLFKMVSFFPAYRPDIEMVQAQLESMMKFARHPRAGMR